MKEVNKSMNKAEKGNGKISKPFTIKKYGRGKYVLLDPDGMDYTGEYLTLADAKRTCNNNFIIEDDPLLKMRNIK